MFYCTFLQFVFGFFKSLSCMPVKLILIFRMVGTLLAIMYMYGTLYISSNLEFFT